MGATLGIHWIATTHGTWLHGNPHGSWQNGRLIGPDPFLEDMARMSMSDDAVVLLLEEQLLVASAFGRLIRERSWRAWTATIQPTHIHVVFAPMPDEINDVIAAMKYRAAREVLDLRRKRGMDVGRSLWTKRPFPRFLFSTEHLVNAIEYVREHNRRVGREDDPYDWLTPCPV